MSIKIFNCKVLFLLSSSSLPNILFFISENEALLTLTAHPGKGDNETVQKGEQQQSIQSPETERLTSVY